MQKKRIGLIFKGTAYAPEIKAYSAFFNNRGHSFRILKSSEDLTDEDIEWHFLGTDFSTKQKGRVKIHEYASLSIPPFAKSKNLFKKLINSKPDLRVFNNRFIETSFSFKDNTNFVIRKAGIGSHFFNKQNIEKTFDYVYIGAMDSTREIDKIIQHFILNFPNNTLLLIGKASNTIQKKFRNQPNLHFSGKIEYEEVPAWLQKARYGINYIPPIYPYRFQASLKLLEYCASELPIITTSYRWVNHFERQRNACFFYLKPDLSNFKPHLIESFDYKIPLVEDFTWENMINQSGLLEFIENS